MFAFNKPIVRIASHTDLSCGQEQPPTMTHNFASDGSDNEDLFQALQEQNVSKSLQTLKKIGVGGIAQDILDNALLAACRQGHKFLVQTLVRLGASVHTSDVCGFTPLLICAEKHFLDIARFLLMKGADVTVVNETGDTALILSIRPAGSVEMTKLLLEQKKVDIEHQNHQGYTALMKAVEAMDIDTIKILTDKQKCCGDNNPQPTNQAVNCHGETLGHIAARVGIGKVVQLLQDVKDETVPPLVNAALMQDLESVDIFIDSSFMNFRDRHDQGLAILEKILQEQLKNSHAFNETDIEVIKKLLANGVEINEIDNYHEAPITTATKIGNYELVHLLCEHGATFDVTSRRDLDPVTIAAVNGRSDLINLLVSFGGRVNTQMTYYSSYEDEEQFIYVDSALDLALRNGNTGCAKLLLDLGAEMDVPSALSSAIEHQIFTYLKFLFDHFGDASQNFLRENSDGEGYMLLHKAVSGGNVDIVNSLLEYGCHINDPVGQESTLLMEATSPDMIRTLIQRGADVNRKVRSPFSFRHETTALLSAVSKFSDSKREGIIATLLENGANANDGDSDGQTPLMRAAARRDNDLNVLQMLISHGADVNMKDRDGATALLHAIQSRRPENAKFLIEIVSNGGADLDTRDIYGLSALMVAVKKSDCEIIKLLLNKGASVNLQNDNGDTALLHAVRNGCSREVLNILISSGADIEYHDKVGNSALIIAAQDMNQDALQLLIVAGADINATNETNNSTALSVLIGRLSPYEYMRAELSSCVEFLLDQGATSSCLNPDALLEIIKEGQVTLIPKLISHGLGPADSPSNSCLKRAFRTLPGPVVSPLCVALLEGNVDLARYFVENWFLTNSDVSSLARNQILRQELEAKNNIECLEFLDNILSRPMPLLKLAFVAVSSAVGCVPGREDKVNSLPLPAVLKEKLLFRKEVVPLTVRSRIFSWR